MQDIDKSLDDKKGAFAEEERWIGTTPLIKLSIDTGDNPPIAKRTYTLSIGQYDWVKNFDKLLEAGVIYESL